MAVVDRDQKINNRSELIAWLEEAAELEQSLMLQYLFAAYSLKKTTAEGITDSETELTRRWESLMLHVARQEMAHLAMVSNLLLAVGGRPHFTRPSMPQPALGYRPFPFTLQRLCDESLARFIRAEQPQPQPNLMALDLIPNAPDYDYTGELYRKISAGFANVDKDLSGRGETLFIGPDSGQAKGNWSTSITISAVTDLPSAQAAIDEIVKEGEGAPVGSANSHWAIFKAIAAEVAAARLANPAFDPARFVADNPMTITHPDVAGVVNLITFEPARQTAGLFNAVYETTLSILMQFFDFAGETHEERDYLQGALSQTMSAIVRPLAEVLTQLPLRDDGTPLRAGPGFEFYGPAFDVSTQIECRWTMLHERMRLEAEGCRELAKQAGSPPRLEYIAENLALRLRNLEGLLAKRKSKPVPKGSIQDARLKPSRGANYQPMRLQMLRLSFEGWFQCRLATDPDPPDEVRGVSGWTFAVAGEPDLDRVIRLQPAGTITRSGGPTVGVTVTKAERGRHRTQRASSCRGRSFVGFEPGL